jgi:hypothetical protein
MPGTGSISSDTPSPTVLTPGSAVLASRTSQKRAQLPLVAAPAENSPSLLAVNALLNGDIPFEDSDTKTFGNHGEFRRLARLGWTDAWPCRNPWVRELSWVSTRTGNRFRYDHCRATSGWTA